MPISTPGSTTRILFPYADVEMSELMFFRGTVPKDIDNGVRQLYQYQKPEIYFTFDDETTITNNGSGPYSGIIENNQLELKNSKYEKNVCLFNDTHVIVDNLFDFIGYTSDRYIKFNYQLKDTTTVGKYPILSIPYSTKKFNKKIAYISYKKS